GNPQAFDHKLTNSISHLRLHLPGNDLRKGTSPFMAAMPYFHNYYSNTPGRVVTSPVALAYDFHAVAGENTFLHLRNVGSCDSPSFPTEFLDTDCSVGDEGVH